MIQLISVLVAILLIALVITTDKNSSKDTRSGESIDSSDYYYKDKKRDDSEESFFSLVKDNRVISFDIYKIKGIGVLNIDRRSFREGLKEALENSNKFKLSYNPNVKMVVAIKEDIIYLRKYVVRKETRDYFVVKKRVKVTAKFALFRDTYKTYYIDKVIYRADLKASSPINYDDAIYKIDKKLYYLVAKKVAKKLLDNYNKIVKRL